MLGEPPSLGRLVLAWIVCEGLFGRLFLISVLLFSLLILRFAGPGPGHARLMYAFCVLAPGCSFSDGCLDAPAGLVVSRPGPAGFASLLFHFFARLLVDVLVRPVWRGVSVLTSSSSATSLLSLDLSPSLSGVVSLSPRLSYSWALLGSYASPASSSLVDLDVSSFATLLLSFL